MILSNELVDLSLQTVEYIFKEEDTRNLMLKIYYVTWLPCFNNWLLSVAQLVFDFKSCVSSL